MWTGVLGEIGIAEHSIEAILNSNSFESLPYCAGPKTRELEQFEVQKQLKAEVIESANSEWAAPMWYGHKNDGKFCIWIYYCKLNRGILKIRIQFQEWMSSLIYFVVPKSSPCLMRTSDTGR